jgi:hypothetical protein
VERGWLQSLWLRFREIPMTDPFGPQYSGDDAFKAAARLRQSRFRVEQLGLTQYNAYGNRLSPEDAAAGKNFYPSHDVLAAVRERYRLSDTALCREHYPLTTSPDSTRLLHCVSRACA